MHSSNHLTHPKYRADIDGLRAIAILSVVAYHAFPDWIKGGFVGVDVFFVISGFLISTIIFGSLDKEAFSFREFYARRIKRICPALILVMSACYALGWFVLLPDEYKQLGKHIAAGAGFVSNLFFWQEASYFDSVAETKPMLHLWSLGIEEQFYIVWPLLLFLTWKRRFNLLFLTLAIIAISFAANVGKVHSDAVQAFYSPVARFWELMLGSLLAYLALHQVSLLNWARRKIGAASGNAVDQDNPVLRNAQSLIGALLICMSVLIVDREKAFPGWWVLLPTLGACLLISAGQHAWLNRMVLSHRAMVWLGLISYPLYLWHWPLLSFARIVESGTPTRGIRIAAIFIALALAWLTYMLIEKPIRFGERGRAKIAVLCVLMTVVGYVGFFTYKQDGSTYKHPGLPYPDYEFSTAKSVDMALVRLQTTSTTKEHDNIHVVRRNTFNTSPKSCGDLFKGSKGVFCGKTSNEPNIVILGDSHAGHLYYGFANSPNEFFNKVSLIGGGCAPLIGVFPPTPEQNCDEKILVSLKWIKEHPSVKIAIISHWAYRLNWSNEQKNLEGYSRTFNELKKLGKKIIYLVDVPNLSFDPEACVDRPFRLPGYEKNKNCNEFEKIDRSGYDSLIKKLRNKFPDVFFYDPSRIFCDNEKCKAILNGRIQYNDTHHLSIWGSELVANSLINSQTYAPLK